MKYILILTTLFFLGCNTSPNHCQQSGYNGMTIPTTIDVSSACSDGEIVNNSYKTSKGLLPLRHHVYLEFPKDEHDPTKP